CVCACRRSAPFSFFRGSFRAVAWPGSGANKKTRREDEDACACILPRDSGGGGPREARWKGLRPRRFAFVGGVSLNPRNPRHHRRSLRSLDGPPPPLARGRISDGAPPRRYDLCSAFAEGYACIMLDQPADLKTKAPTHNGPRRDFQQHLADLE